MRPNDETEIRRVLRTEARPRPITPDEHARILARLERDEPTGGPGTENLEHQRTVPFSTAHDRHEHRSSHLRPILLGCAAATLILALVAGLLAVRSEPDTGPAASTIERTPSCPAVWNADHVVPLAEAVAQWRTVENWAFTRGEPDLGDLATTALEAASNLPDAEQRNSATTALADLTESLSSIDDTSIVDSLTAAQTRIDAVEQAIAAVDDISASNGDQCELRLVDSDS